jgi:hypothetical protein
MKNSVSMTKAPETTSYEQWMRSEGIPIIRTLGGVEDTRLVEREPWARLGGRGAFIVMQGLQESGFTGMYVVEVPAQGALNPERHVFEELLYVLQGRGPRRSGRRAVRRRPSSGGRAASSPRRSTPGTAFTASAPSRPSCWG